MATLSMSLLLCIVIICFVSKSVFATTYTLSVESRTTDPVLSYYTKKSDYQQIFNPSWIEASEGTSGKRGIIARTQNCDPNPDGSCAWCGGSQAKASILTFSELVDGGFTNVDSSSVVFGPYDDTDSWGTEDPRVKYNPVDKQYYMYYTAYNGSSIFLSLATSPNPTKADSWTRYGPVFPNLSTSSKSAALLIRDKPPHYLLWGDHEIKIAQSDDLTSWPADGGNALIQIRSDNFDSQLVESGPPPMRLSNGDYLFFYNSAQVGWPQDLTTSYNVAWVILDGEDPTIIKQRAQVPLLSPQYAWEAGSTPYSCNAPNVVFLEAAYELGNNRFQVYFGGSDSTIGGAVIKVDIAE